MPRLTAVAVAVAVLFLFLPSSLFAQDLESFAGLRLRFEAPGARSAAMGGASVGLSDSFSAATNPASLARQRNRLAALETRQTSSSIDYVTGGTVGAFTTSSFENQSRGVSSAIVVLPGNRSTWALYYDEPIDASTDTNLIRPTGDLIALGIRDEKLVSESECTPPPGVAPDCSFMYFSAPAVARLQADYRVRRYGAATARAFGRVALGGGVQYAQLEERTDGLAGGQNARGGRWTWNGGLQVELSSRVHLGASYRSGARYDAERKILTVNGFEWVSTGIRTPSSMAAGIAADVTPNLTVAADVVRVNYSEMLRDNYLSFLAGSDATTLYAFPDVNEVRAGAEYRLRTRIPVALRAGWWLEPAHRVRAKERTSGMANESLNLVMLLDQDENHVTAGIGVGDRVRLDAAYDRSENTSRASLALAATF